MATTKRLGVRAGGASWGGPGRGGAPPGCETSKISQHRPKEARDSGRCARGSTPGRARGHARAGLKGL
eukprot:15468657-Alexandrium_andersonii.AAC.1